MKKLKEIEIGLITVIAIAVLYWGINYLKGINLFNSKRTFYAIYDQVNGLVTSNVVTVNGYKIGIVENISFIHGDPKGRLLVKFSINNKDIEIPANSVAKIQNDLLGTASIVILIGNSPEKAKSGDTLKSALATTLQQEVSLQMLPIKTKAENLMLSLDSVLAVIQYVFNEQTRENLSRSFESIKITIK
ncbi:MAG TPA: MlaD family protein, partial [Bacteroidales bacterium]|nr:MlaD family protein [Bacteroidales bacterium]